VQGWSTQFIANPCCWPQRPCPKRDYISAILDEHMDRQPGRLGGYGYWGTVTVGDGSNREKKGKWEPGMCVQRKDSTGRMVRREEIKSSSNRPELAAFVLALRGTPVTKPMLYLPDNQLWKDGPLCGVHDQFFFLLLIALIYWSIGAKSLINKNCENWCKWSGLFVKDFLLCVCQNCQNLISSS